MGALLGGEEAADEEDPVHVELLLLHDPPSPQGSLDAGRGHPTVLSKGNRCSCESSEACLDQEHDKGESQHGDQQLRRGALQQPFEPARGSKEGRKENHSIFMTAAVSTFNNSCRRIRDTGQPGCKPGSLCPTGKPAGDRRHFPRCPAEAFRRWW